MLALMAGLVRWPVWEIRSNMSAAKVERSARGVCVCVCVCGDHRVPVQRYPRVKRPRTNPHTGSFIVN